MDYHVFKEPTSLWLEMPSMRRQFTAISPRSMIQAKYAQHQNV